MSFITGEQPCNNFQQQQEANAHAQWGNEHQCYKCGGIVSFCNNCHTDHHKNGYETCNDYGKWYHSFKDTEEAEIVALSYGMGEAAWNAALKLSGSDE